MQQVAQVIGANKFRGLAVASAVFVFGLMFAVPVFAATTTSRPVSVGNYDQWSLGAGLNKVGAVTSSDSESSYIYETNNGDDQTFVVANAGLPAGSVINSVTLNVVARESSGEPKIKLRMERAVGDTSDGSDLHLTGSYATYSRTRTTNPFTGSAWTLAEVNAWTVRFGVDKDNESGTIRVTQIYVVVDYTIPDTTAPTLTLVTAVPNSTNDTTPDFTFTSSEAGKIIYTGDCSSVSTSTVAGNKTITFNTLSAGTHSNCSIQVADASANTSTALIVPAFVVDTTKPVINSHDSVSAEATGPGTTTPVFYTLPTATDNIDLSVIVTCSPASGTLFAMGATNVTCNAADLAGNSATPTVFSVVVQDTTAPVIAPHGDVIAEAADASGVVVVYSAPGTTDAVSGASTATCLPASGSLFPLTTTTVVCNAADGVGNISVSTTFNVVVRDTTVPVITLISGPISLNVGDTYVEFGATASDTVDGDVTANIVINSSSLNTSVPGPYSVTYNVVDAHGNSAAQVARVVTVSDVTAPVIHTISDVTLEALGELGAAFDYGVIMATDDVDGDIIATCSHSTSSPFAIGTSTSGVTPVTCTATDSTGNIGVGLAFTVTVQDTTAPVIVVTPVSPVEATSSLGAVATYTVSATDIVNGGISSRVVCYPASDSMFPLGETTVVCTVSDSHGNSATGTAVIVVHDTTDPQVTAPANQTFEATGFLTYPTLVQATATDEVDPSPVITSTPSGFPLGTLIVSWTATDASGNVGFGASNVTIVDTTVPVITIVGDTTIHLNVGQTYTEQGATVTDNSGGELSVTIGGDVVNTAVAGTYHVTYDAVDSSGNHAAQQIRTVIISTPPSEGGNGGGGSGVTYVAPTPPSFGDNPITVGAGLGNTSTVQLTFDVQNASWVAISESPDFSGTSWFPYTTNTIFTLSASNTAHKLYIKFRRVNGGETKVQEVNVLLNSPSTLIQAVLGVKVTRLNELANKLKFGNRGAEVRELQTLLKEAGYFPARQTATGYYGPITRASVQKYLAAIKK